MRVRSVVAAGLLVATSTAGADGHPVIDVLVAHTPSATARMGNVERWTRQRVEETNGAFTASGIRARLCLAGTLRVVYHESGDMWTDLVRLREISDGHMDEVPAVRDRVAADLVALVIPRPFRARVRLELLGRGEPCIRCVPHHRLPMGWCE